MITVTITFVLVAKGATGENSVQIVLDHLCVCYNFTCTTLLGNDSLMKDATRFSRQGFTTEKKSLIRGKFDVLPGNS